MRKSFARLSCSDDTKKEHPLVVPHSGQPSQPPSEQHVDYQAEPPVAVEKAPSKSDSEQPLVVPHSGQPSQPPSEQHVDYQSEPPVAVEKAPSKSDSKHPFVVPHSGQPSQPPSEQHVDYQSESSVEEAVEESVEESEEEVLEFVGETSSEQDSQSSSFEEYYPGVFQVRMFNNEFSIPNVRFIGDGDAHHIVISFDNWRQRFMELTIDNEIIYEVDTSSQIIGYTKLNIEEMAVYFEWDLIVQPMKFKFRTRGFYFNGSSDEDNSEDGEVFNLIEIEVTE
ncbi:hypothetical protein MA16_Dca004602 [Dendrobium catenatum]|uniref:Uncharacterized protein n=1 Tax=Dendrobium catenatum TaxID=906689 RepID=A0A2I0VNK4_9ASPA|nr:hypothetical protein MA16_Dca004602 [Dendrobium catenatum]